MVAITFLGIFYIVFLVGMIILYFNNTIQADIWLQAIILMCILTVFINMIPFILYQTSHDLNNAQQIDKVVLDNVDLNDLVLVNEIFNDNVTYHLSRFTNINNKIINDIQKTEVCIYLNNSDASNVVYIGTIDFGILRDISEPIFVNSNEVGWFCQTIDSCSAINTDWLGLHCSDCNSTNIINFQVVNNSINNVTKFIGNESQNIELGSVVFEKPHAIYLRLYNLPSQLINKNYYRLLFFIGTFALIFIMRWIYNITRDGVDYED